MTKKKKKAKQERNEALKRVKDVVKKNSALEAEAQELRAKLKKRKRRAQVDPPEDVQGNKRVPRGRQYQPLHSIPYHPTYGAEYITPEAVHAHTLHAHSAAYGTPQQQSTNLFGTPQHQSTNYAQHGSPDPYNTPQQQVHSSDYNFNVEIDAAADDY